jgi:predicted permease
MALGIVIRQIAILAILVLIGLAASRAKVISSELKDLLARIIFYVTLPAMLLTNFSKLTITPELLSSSLQALLLSLFVLLFMLLAGWLTSKMAGLRSGPAAIFCLRKKFYR